MCLLLTAARRVGRGISFKREETDEGTTLSRRYTTTQQDDIEVANALSAARSDDVKSEVSDNDNVAREPGQGPVTGGDVGDDNVGGWVPPSAVA